MDARKPWNKRSDETDAAFAAFRAFLQMPPSTRHLAAVADETGAAHSTVKTWSSQYDWSDRADAYQRHQQTRHEERKVEALQELSEELVALMRHAIDAARGDADDYDPQLLRDLLDRAGLEPDRTININPGDEEAALDKLDQLLPTPAADDT